MPTHADRPPPSTGYLLWRLAIRWRTVLDRGLAPLGLTSAQYGVLASLYGLSRGGGQPSQRELADFAGLEPMQVSKVTRTLERAGLVERAANPVDTRAVQLRITDLGAQAVTAGRKMVLELEDQRLAPLGGRQSDQSVHLRDTLLILLRHIEHSDQTHTESRTDPRP